MLAITLALAFAFHGDPFVQSTTVQSVDPLAAAGHAVQGPVMLPYGQAFGTYDIGMGKMSALLEDASGVPLWVLDAEVYENGGLDGDLLMLQYASNPAIPVGVLSVSGQLLLDEQGNGSFFATVFQYGGGAIPVFPVAMIEGQVQSPALGHSVPPNFGRSRLIAAVTDPDVYGPQVVRSGVIVCPKDVEPELSALQSVGNMAQGGFAKFASRTHLIVDPALAIHSGSGGLGVASAGAKRERAAAGHELLGPALARVQLRWWLLQ